MKSKQKIVKTPLGEVVVTVNEKMVSHQNDPAIQRKVAEAAQFLKKYPVPSTVEEGLD